MTITTIEALEAVTPDTTIEVTDPGQGAIRWVRTPEGFRNPNGVVLPVTVFAGSAAAGRITDASTAPPAEGNWYMYGGNYVFCYSRARRTENDEQRRWNCVVLRPNGNMHDVIRWADDAFTTNVGVRATVAPEWATGIYMSLVRQVGAEHEMRSRHRAQATNYATMLEAEQATTRDVRRQLAQVEADLVVARTATDATNPWSHVDMEALTEDLHRFAETEDSDLYEIIERHNLGTAHARTVYVVGTGRRRFRPEGDGDIEYEEVEVPFTARYRYTAQSRRGDETCICDNDASFDEALARENLPEGTVMSTVSWRYDCSAEVDDDDEF